MNLFKVGFAAMLLIASSACNKEHTNPTPAISSGDCQYGHSGLTQAEAQAGMDLITSILTNSEIGNSIVVIKSQNLYPSTSTKNGQPVDWGYQVVFSCDDAGIKFEEKYAFKSGPAAQTAMEQRAAVIAATEHTKILEKWSDDLQSQTCQTCSSTETGTSWDCNCTYNDNYYYHIAYVIVNSKSSNQTELVGAFQSLNSMAMALDSNSKGITVSDSLKMAARLLPEASAESANVRRWGKLLNKIQRQVHAKKTFHR